MKDSLLSDTQRFANALRACLGLGPLYGTDDKPSVIEEREFPYDMLSDDWFEASEGGEHQRTREEFRAIGMERSLAKLKTRGRTP